jgi:outer membrane receptor protein involved in Fe transport
LSDERNLDQISPRLSVAYQFRAGHTAYAALSTGIEAPAFNEIDPPAPFDTLTTLNPFLEPAHSLTLEVGAKGVRLLTTDGKNLLRYDVALYGLEVRNDIIPFDGGAYYMTAGKSRRAGIELGGEVVTAAGVSSRAACSLTHNEYVEYTNDFGTFDGNESAGLPNITFDFRGRYDSRWGAYLESAVHSRGSYFADDANTAHVAAFGTWDATVGLMRPLGRTRLDAFFSVANLLDTPYIASVFINGTNGRYYEPGMERNLHFGLSLRYE